MDSQELLKIADNGHQNCESIAILKVGAAIAIQLENINRSLEGINDDLSVIRNNMK